MFSINLIYQSEFFTIHSHSVNEKFLQASPLTQTESQQPTPRSQVFQVVQCRPNGHHLLWVHAEVFYLVAFGVIHSLGQDKGEHVGPIISFCHCLGCGAQYRYILLNPLFLYFAQGIVKTWRPPMPPVSSDSYLIVILISSLLAINYNRFI